MLAIVIFPQAALATPVNKVKLKTAGKDGMKYLENRTYPGPVMNGMLVWMGENQAEGADAAIEFLKTQEDVWTKWVSGSAAKKIKKAL